jgi:hypothetical protein
MKFVFKFFTLLGRIIPWKIMDAMLDGAANKPTLIPGKVSTRVEFYSMARYLFHCNPIIGAEWRKTVYFGGNAS